MPNESYLMQQIHKQLERDSQVLYRKFRGDINRWLKWMEEINVVSVDKKRMIKPKVLRKF